MLIHHRKKILTGLFILLAVFSLYYFLVYNSYKGVVDGYAEYISYEDANSLVDSAELVVIATPVKEFDDREHSVTKYGTGSIQDFYTKTELKVEKVLKGEWDQNDLTVIEPVSYVQNIDGKRKITQEGYSEMLKDHSYIITLKKNYLGEYSVINMKNGVFDLNEEASFKTFLTNDDDDDSHTQIKEELYNMFNL